MKKILSAALALIMVFALTTVAFAEGADASLTFNIPVYYNLKNPKTTKPAETFTVTIGDCTGVTNNDSATVTDAPKFTSNTDTLSFTESSETEDVQFAVFTVDSTSLSKVGYYSYNMTIAGSNDLAGVTYDSNTAVLTVFVVQGENPGELKTFFKVVYDENKVTGGKWNDQKQEYEKYNDTTEAGDTFTNLFEASAPDDESEAKGLAISKTVTGKLGDKTKEFNVTVSFSSDKKVTAPITYTDGTEQTVPAFTLNDNKYTSSVVITLKDGETVAFANVPYGVSYEVVEDDYTSLGYAEADYTNENGTIDDVSIEVSIVNDYDSEIDTGVFLDFAPYVMIIAFIVVAAVMMIMKKRKVEEA